MNRHTPYETVQIYQMCFLLHRIGLAPNFTWVRDEQSDEVSDDLAVALA